MAIRLNPRGAESAIGLVVAVAAAHAGFLWLLELAGSSDLGSQRVGGISADGLVASVGSSVAALVLIAGLSLRSAPEGEASALDALVAPRLLSGLALAGIILASAHGVATSERGTTFAVLLQATGLCVALLVDRAVRLKLRPSSWIRWITALAAISAAMLADDESGGSISLTSLGLFAICLFARLYLISRYGKGRSDKLAYYRVEQFSAAIACMATFGFLWLTRPGSMDLGLDVILLPFLAGSFLAVQGLFSTLIKLLALDNTTCSFLSQLGAGVGVILAELLIYASAAGSGWSLPTWQAVAVGILLAGFAMSFVVDRRGAEQAE